MSKRSLDGAIKRPNIQTTPSKVLHVRGCPYVRESDLVTLCSPFGSVLRTFIMPNKNQAFVEMDSLESATNVLTHYASTPAYIGTKQVYLQYSARNEITGTNRIPVESKTGEPPVNTVLIVTVENDTIPVTLDHLHQIFSAYGLVKRIITFNKNNEFKALIEMGSLDAALAAKLHLEGKDIFQGCCTLRLGFSTLPELSVKQNGPRCRDYTAPFDPTVQYMMPNTAVTTTGLMPAMPHSQYPQAPFNPYAPVAQSYPVAEQKTPVLLINNLPEDKVTPDILFTLFGVYGDVIRVKILFNKKDTALIQFRDSNQAHTAHTFLNRVKLFGKDIIIQTSKFKEVQLPNSETADGFNLTKDFTGSPLHRFKKPNSRNEKNITSPTTMLLITNLPDQITAEELKPMFGDQAISVVISQSSDKKMAFLRMASVESAIEALILHHNTLVGDKNIRISFSRREGPSDQSGSAAANSSNNEAYAAASLVDPNAAYAAAAAATMDPALAYANYAYANNTNQ